MDHLYGTGKGQCSLRGSAAQAAGLQGEDRPDSFASRHQRILHRLLQTGIPDVSCKNLLQTVCYHGKVLCHLLCKAFFHVTQHLRTAPCHPLERWALR